MADNNVEKPVYVPIPNFTKAEMEKALVENDVEKLIYVPVFASLYYEDRSFAEEICIKLANHSHGNVRAMAIEGFEHIARIDGQLNEEIIKPIISEALKDDNEIVRDRAEWTRDATKQYFKWKYK